MAQSLPLQDRVQPSTLFDLSMFSYHWEVFQDHKIGAWEVFQDLWNNIHPFSREKEYYIFSPNSNIGIPISEKEQNLLLGKNMILGKENRILSEKMLYS